MNFLIFCRILDRVRVRVRVRIRVKVRVGVKVRCNFLLSISIIIKHMLTETLSGEILRIQ